MPAAPESLRPSAPASPSQQQIPAIKDPSADAQRPKTALPASIAGAFAAAQYSLQHSLDQQALPEDEDAGLLPQLYASRIGPHSQAFYLAQFKRFDTLDRSLPGWNMAAAFFTLAWCCLRGLWREAALYLAAVTALALLWWFGLRPTLPSAVAMGVGAALWLASCAVPGLLGNGWYWRKVRQQTLQAIADAPNMAQVHAALRAQAAPGHQKLAAMLVLALPLAAAAGAGLALLPVSPAAPAVAPAAPPAPPVKPASPVAGKAQAADGLQSQQTKPEPMPASDGKIAP